MNVVQFLHFVYTPQVSAPASSFLCGFAVSGTLFKSHLPQEIVNAINTSKCSIYRFFLCLGVSKKKRKNVYTFLRSQFGATFSVFSSSISPLASTRINSKCVCRAGNTEHCTIHILCYNYSKYT